MTEIQELLQRYFDLLYTCDVSRYDSVFHPNAQLQTVGDSGYAMITAPAYREILSKRASPASLGAERSDEVLTIDLSSSTTAVVKAQALINGTRYRDNLTLLKVADGWRIVSKVYCVVRADSVQVA
jgi:hypothetical protein